MDRESVDRLRFDRRLERRRGWVEEKDQEANLESLPDVADKMTRGLDDPDDSADAPDATPATGLGAAAPVGSPPVASASSMPESTPFSGGGSELS